MRPVKIKSTSDPHIFIEEEKENYIRYCADDGRRWEVHGKCTKLGNCLIGAVIKGYGMIETHEDIEKAKQKLGRERIDSELDVPVGPGFNGCCQLWIVEI